MPIRFFLFLVLSFFGLCLSCNPDDSLSRSDYFIFGRFFGYCSGEHCVEIFKLTKEELLEDQIDDPRGRTLEFERISEAQFEVAKGLIDDFPAQLWRADEERFGCPDCYDGGGLYIERKEGNKTKMWLIDRQKDKIPDYLHDFVDAVEETIRAINQ